MPSDIFDEDVAAHKWSFARILELGPVGRIYSFLETNCFAVIQFLPKKGRGQFP